MTVIRPNSIAGVTSITAQGDNISFYSSDGVGISQFNVNINSTSGVSTVANLNVTGIATAFKYETPALINNHFKSNSTSSGDYVRMYAGGGTAQWDIYGNGELLRMGDNSSSATAKVQFDNPTFHRSTAITTGVAALTAKQEVNNGGYLIFDGKNSSDTTVFSVTHNGRINLSENIVFASGQGIDFSANANAAGMTSELLDHYEEGTWTPTISTIADLTFTQPGTITQGEYIRIGTLVYIRGFLRIENDPNTGTGNVRISGLPYAGNAGGYGQYAISVFGSGLTLASGEAGCVGLVNESGSGIDIYTNNIGGNRILNHNDIQTGSVWYFAGCYHVLGF